MKDIVWPSAPDLDAFASDVERGTDATETPTALSVEKGVPIYDGATVDGGVAQEWVRVLSQGAGVFVIKRAFADLDALDAATRVFQDIIAAEREAGATAGDHFAAAGTNDRIWNSAQKLCLRDPGVFARYMGNPVIDLACRAWLGPGYQIATQVNQVRPGGKAQAAHRDYHLGFMTGDQMASYPPHVHSFSPMLILQGGVAHSDMSPEAGTTKLLPRSQRFQDGYVAALRDDFRDYFEANHIQLSLAKGDAIFFSPALFHAAGANRSKDVVRMVNLLQVASPFARHMEQVDRTTMCLALFPHLAGLGEAERTAAIAAAADGYPFPTNLDLDPPVGGLAPPTQQDLLAQAVREKWTQAAFKTALEEQAAKRMA